MDGWMDGYQLMLVILAYDNYSTVVPLSSVGFVMVGSCVVGLRFLRGRGGGG